MLPRGARTVRFGIKPSQILMSASNCSRAWFRLRPAFLAVLCASAVLAAVLLVASSHATAAPPVPVPTSPALAQQQPEAANEPAEAESEGHGLPQPAVEIGRFLGFAITNSMIVSWIVALGLIGFAQFATRKMSQVPSGSQNFLEWLVEGLYGFIEGLVGSKVAARTFWYFGTIFIFILAANWAGLIPGVGTIGWGHRTSHGFVIDQPLFRGANADVNMTLAMALVFFACWLYWSIQEIGVVGFFKELFGPKGESTGLLKYLMIVIFFAAGCLEVISILFRPISLGFRLYGNVFAGENMLEAMARMVPGLNWLIPIPFYFLELLMGLVQALVFMLLTAVFTFLMCQHGEETASAHH